MTDKKQSKLTYDSVLAKASEGIEKLTQEELDVLTYDRPAAPKVIESKDVNPSEKKSIYDRKTKGQKLAPKDVAVIQGDKIDKQDEVVNRVIHGFNDVWSKHYDYKEDKASFDISIREPNIAEYGRVVAERNKYLQGTGAITEEGWNEVYYALALIRICGEEVPRQLAEDENMYAPQIVWLRNIYQDFSKWEAQFRG